MDGFTQRFYPATTLARLKCTNLTTVSNLTKKHTTGSILENSWRESKLMSATKRLMLSFTALLMLHINSSKDFIQTLLEEKLTTALLAFKSNSLRTRQRPCLNMLSTQLPRNWRTMKFNAFLTKRHKLIRHKTLYSTMLEHVKQHASKVDLKKLKQQDFSPIKSSRQLPRLLWNNMQKQVCNIPLMESLLVISSQLQ